MAARTRADAGVDRAPGVPWLVVQGGELRDPRGAPVRLLGLHSRGGAADTDLLDLQTLLAPVPEGARCVALGLRRVAQLHPTALVALDQRVAALAAAGAYTLLRVDARLWLHGHHLRLARRYAGAPAVQFALLGRAPLAERLRLAARALRAVHPAAAVWLPIEASAGLPADRAPQGVGWLWDAARPQSPPPAGLRATLHAPVLLDGWQPSEHHPLADERLVRLCRDGGIGWLAQGAAPWTRLERGVPVLARAARSLQRAVFQAADSRAGLVP